MTSARNDGILATKEKSSEHMDTIFEEFSNTGFPNFEEQQLDFLLERMRNVRKLNKASALLLKELEAELETKFPNFNKLD